MAAEGPDRFLAATDRPWLRIEPGRPLPAGGWIRLRYRAGLEGDPVRPLLRIHRAGMAPDHAILPGPVAGGGVWTGPLPADCTGLSISPVARAGSFAFRLDTAERVRRLQLVAEGLGRKPGLAITAIVDRLRGRRVRARHLVGAILASTPFHGYAGWRSARIGPPLPSGDAPDDGPALTILIEGETGGPEALGRTLASLRAQTSPAWRAIWVRAESSDLAEGLSTMGPAAALTEAATRPGWVGAIRAGDTLAAETVASLRAALRRSRGADLVYVDEDRLDPAGGRLAPMLKPDWSPRLHESLPFADGAAFVRSEGLRVAELGGGSSEDGRLHSLSTMLVGAALAKPGASVLHLRRILLHRDGAPPVARAAPPPMPERWPLVSIVVPSRDRLNLLRPCLEGLLGRTDYPALEIVLVDNGSTDPETLGYYRTLADEPRVTILERPGPFNYSALTNDGVAAARGSHVLLLNNDMEVVRPDWLRRLVAEARPDDVGAVGAKLLYPDGRVQHAGVVIGLGGAAGHIYRLRKDRPPGWMARLAVTHEVSAVTGACLLVSRAMFDEVGGLDAEHLPVSFNDIDLCLKLRARGWRNLLVPDAVLVHHESASRGRDDRGEKQRRAEREARVFAERWLPAMRDDPYWHPGLSLARYEPMLG